jgi:hypothetical protein
MKKSVVVIALAFGVTNAFAQDLTSKKGEPILPEAGDWAISMNADPIFEFVGNAFSGYTGKNFAPGVKWVNGEQTIIGKKFIDEKNAYRVLVRLGFTNQTFKNLVYDDAQTTPPVFPAQPGQKTDKLSVSNTTIGIGAGKEMRRGKTRLQGYYGADAMIWLSMSGEKYTYGNTMTAVPTGPGTTNTPTTTDFSSPLPGGGYASAPAASRTTKVKSGLDFGIGVRGFIGAEYFILPKISVGAEYGWGIGFETQAKGKMTTEEQQVVNGTNVVAEVERATAGSSNFGFDTDLNQGTIFGFHGSNTGTASLKVTFHF